MLQKNSFELPLGLRLWPSESRSSVHTLKEGYSFSLLESSSDSYRFSILASACSLAGLFQSLSSCLPEESFLILEYYQEEMDKGDEQPEPTVFYSPYVPTKDLLQILSPYLERLIHDGFVGFGLANNREGVEFFLSEEKVLTCFTGNHLRTTHLLAQHQIAYRPQLLYPTDLGHDHLSLLCHPRNTLPDFLAGFSDSELDYLNFCGELTERLDMYPVEETIPFFLSKKEQDCIELRLRSHSEFVEFAEEDFGTLLLDWTDFVGECENAFEGDLWEYRQGLILRDMIEYVISGMNESLQEKLRDIIADADERFQKVLTDRRKRLDLPAFVGAMDDRFWYRGVIRNQGVSLRRDLIREGWFKP